MLHSLVHPKRANLYNEIHKLFDTFVSNFRYFQLMHIKCRMQTYMTPVMVVRKACLQQRLFTLIIQAWLYVVFFVANVIIMLHENSSVTYVIINPSA